MFAQRLAHGKLNKQEQTMEKDSIPEQEQGDQQDHSPIENSADTAVIEQPLEDDKPQFFEEQDDSDDAPSQTTEEDDDTTDESNDEGVDPELTKWATSQNLALNTETEIKLAKRLRDTQNQFHEKTNEAKQLRDKYESAAREVATDQTVSDSAKLARMEFFMDNPSAKEYEGEMFDIAIETKDSGDTAGFKYFQSPQGWRTLLKIAQARRAETQSEDSYTAGRADERKNLAKKQQASAPKRNATDTALKDTKITDEQVNNMSLAEYDRFRKSNPSWNPFQG